MFTGKSKLHITVKARSEKALCWQGWQSIPQWYFVGGFPQMQAMFFCFPDGKNEHHRSGLNPDRHKKVKMRFISARITWSQMEGAQHEERQWRKNKIKYEKKNGKDQYRLTITLVSAWGNGHPYCISTRDGSP